MNTTMNFYNNNANEYCAQTVGSDMSQSREQFLAHLPVGARILDAGCGSGRDAKVFMEQGYMVTALDGSYAMCQMAEKHTDLPVLHMSFDEIEFKEEFDGIWACASLLHVPKADMENILSKLRNALVPDGVIYASFKYGEGERTVDGRFFNDYNENSLRMEFESCGFNVIEIVVTEDVRGDRTGEMWVNVIGRK